MKKKSPPYALIGALLLGVVAVYVYHLIQVREQAAEAKKIADLQAADQAALAAANSRPSATVSVQPTNMRNVLYATQTIEPGIRVSSAFYETKLTPTDILPDAYTDKDDIVGWYATHHIEKGDPLTPHNIGKSLPYLSQRIPTGMRAITLAVLMGGDVNDTGGFVVDGDRVDLLYSLTTPNNAWINTQTVLQNVQVLYVPGPQIKTDVTDGIAPVPSAGGTVAITFLVTPEEAEALVLMSHVKEAHFTVILRGRQDQIQRKVKAFNVDDYDWVNLTKLQKTVDRSEDQVKTLQAQIEAAEKSQSSQGTTNETNPTPPTP